MNITKLKVLELRKELSHRGLDTTGTCPILRKRLREAIALEAAPSAIPAESPTAPQPPSLSQVSPEPTDVITHLPEPEPVSEPPSVAEEPAEVVAGAGKEGEGDDLEARLRKRQERFGVVEKAPMSEEELRRRRAAKFGPVGKTSIEGGIGKGGIGGGIGVDAEEMERRIKRRKRFESTAA